MSDAVPASQLELYVKLNKSTLSGTSNELELYLNRNQAIDLAFAIHDLVKASTTAIFKDYGDSTGYFRTFTVGDRTLTIKRGENDYVTVWVKDDMTKFTWCSYEYTRIKDTEVRQVRAWTQSAVAYLHGRGLTATPAKPDENKTAARAEPARTTPTENMQTPAQTIREKERNLLAEHKAKTKENKKLAKAMSRLIVEGMSVHILDPARITAGTPTAPVDFQFWCSDPNAVYPLLTEAMGDTGFYVQRNGSATNKLLVRATY